MDCCALLQWIFRTQGLNPCLLYLPALADMFFTSRATWERSSVMLLLLLSLSVMSDSVQPNRQQPTRLPCPWDSPGKSTGVGCHFLLQCMKVKSESEFAQLCPTPSDPMDCSPPGSSIHGIFQARVQEWGAIAFSIVLSVQFSCSVVFDSLRPHESQHTRPPCPSPMPRVH